MEVYQRAGRWYVDAVHPATKIRFRRSLDYKGNKTEAQRRAVAMLAKLAAETEDGKPTMAVGDAVDGYLGALRSWNKTSVGNLEFIRDKLFGTSRDGKRWSMSRDIPVHTIRPIDMERLVQARRSEGNGAQTIAHEIGLVRSAVKWAQGLGYKGPEAMVGVKNPWRVPEIVEKTRYLSVEEFKMLYDHLSPDRKITYARRSGERSAAYHLPEHIRKGRQDCQDLLVALTFTGARWSEMAGLRWSQVDLDAGMIRLWGNKTGRERVVPIAKPLRDVLTRRRGEALSDGPSKLVFPGQNGAIRAQSSEAIRHAMNECGLNTDEMVRRHGRATVHSLRHTFASWVAQSGEASLQELMESLGHADIQSTLRYAHLTQQGRVEKLGGILDSIGAGQ